MSGTRPLLICLMGPTAAGKTDLAVDLARHLDCELISVDSAMVYRGLDIGTAKPDYPHHLVDIRDVCETYSAAQFARDTRRLVGEIHGRGRTPLLVGGTMLYFRAFLDGLADLPPADPEVRAGIAALARRCGWPAVHEELARVDPAAAARIHPNHSQRLGRALEVYRISGVPLSRWQAAGTAQYRDPRREFAAIQLAICPAPRAVLHQRIERRFRAMLAAGLVDEVARLRSRGDVSGDLPALRAVGYRQIGQYLAGECTLDEAAQRAIVATRQLAKRQLTWLRNWPDLNWIVTDAAGAVRGAREAQPVACAPRQTPLAAALNYLDFAPS